LTRHEQSHNADRPYKCPLCGRIFARQDTLSRHLTSHAKARLHKTGDRRLTATNDGLATFTATVRQGRDNGASSNVESQVKNEPSKGFLDTAELLKHVQMPSEVHVPPDENMISQRPSVPKWPADQQLATTDTSSLALTQRENTISLRGSLPDDLYSSKVDLQARQWLRDLCAQGDRVSEVPPNG
jgi:uncharacterized C2H2 Zn-finger protein